MPCKFSIIIAIRNEEDNIPSLIASLTKLNYSTSNYEIIFVDDNSTDSSYKLISGLIMKYPNYKIIKAETHALLQGKKAALSTGIAGASFPYILTTDADCTIGSNWLKVYSDKFNEGFDILFGIAPFVLERFYVNHVAAFENFRNSLLSFTLADCGLPYNAFGRNFGFKKDVFIKLNGYNEINKTLSGDDDLFLLLAAKYNYKIGTVKSKDAFVFSSTKRTFKQFLLQRSRHTKTSAIYPLRIKAILAFWHILNIILTGSILFVPFSNYFLIPFCSKMLIDFATTIISQRKYGYRFNLLAIIPLQISYEVLIIVHFISSKITKDKW